MCALVRSCPPRADDHERARWAPFDPCPPLPSAARRPPFPSLVGGVKSPREVAFFLSHLPRPTCLRPDAAWPEFARPRCACLCHRFVSFRFVLGARSGGRKTAGITGPRPRAFRSHSGSGSCICGCRRVFRSFRGARVRYFCSGVETWPALSRLSSPVA